MLELFERLDKATRLTAVIVVGVLLVTVVVLRALILGEVPDIGEILGGAGIFGAGAASRSIGVNE